MQWFKHDSNANTDDKLQNLLLDYGLEGYGLYWYCLELIVNRVDKDNINFELKHDARIIAKNTGSTVQKVEEMMRYFVTVGLFENNNGFIRCLKLLKRMDTSMTSNKFMREIITKAKNHHDAIMISRDAIMQEEKRREENINTLVRNDVADDCPHQEIIKLYHEHLPMLTQVKIWNSKRQTLLKTRWKESKERQNLDYWKRLFQYISKSDFLTGKTSHWQADLEWIVNSSNLTKIIEGRYENKEVANG